MLLDVLGIQADAAVAGAQADAVGLVGAVDQVAAPAEREFELAERIVRARLDHRRQVLAVVVEVILAQRGRGPPDRILDVADDTWSRPAAWTSRPCRCRSGAYRRSAARLSCAAESNTAACAATLMTMPSRGASGSTKRVGTTMLRPAPGKPGVDARIGAHDLLVADIEAPRDVRQRVLLARRA